ncbi:hypothetical protein [Stieleria neptunia]|nr:hypothetical protein [Stieleria neptunia]
MPIQLSIRSLLIACTLSALWILLFRVASGLALTIVFLTPLPFALVYRRSVVNTPGLRVALVRVPLLLILFVMFVVGLSGPALAFERPNMDSNLLHLALYLPPAYLYSYAIEHKHRTLKETLDVYFGWWDRLSD